VDLQATQAYLEGDKALAKKLGANGRWHAAQMAKAHAAASEDIFRQRNPTPKGERCLLRGVAGALVQPSHTILCLSPGTSTALSASHRLPSSQAWQLGSAHCG
jgi:hypothetical protein